jgi:hypothetical protein
MHDFPAPWGNALAFAATLYSENASLRERLERLVEAAENLENFDCSSDSDNCHSYRRKDEFRQAIAAAKEGK